MPVYKFRSLEEAADAVWLAADDPRLAQRISELWAAAARMHRPFATPGVRRFRSVQEAQDARVSQ